MFEAGIAGLGIAPIGWTNDDMPDLGSENSFEKCVDDMAEAGYAGTEIGNKYPSEPKVLKEELHKRGLRVANAWFSSFLTTRPYAETERDFAVRCAFLRTVGADCIGASEQGNGIQGQMHTPVMAAKHVMDAKEWNLLTAGLEKLGKIASDHGLFLVYHHHMGTVVQTEEETRRLMEATTPGVVDLLYDSGHFAYAGEDPLAMLVQFLPRIRHVHLKDIRPDQVERVRREGLSFLQGVRNGTFTVPGDGAIDFTPIFQTLSAAGYNGWLLVEAEQDPAVANPLEYAKKARRYIHETTGL